MNPAKSITKLDATGADLLALAERLYPITRSITGPGVRETLRILQEYIPLEAVAVPSGTPVLDWTVPDEWTLREAYIETSTGERVVDVADSNLHVVNYSEPVDKTMTLAELKPHLYSLPEQLELIPYRTSYYNRTWGFCLQHERLESLKEDSYRVVIDSDLQPGVLNYGELFLAGESKEEVLFSTHICHPSLANDNLSGITVLTHLARHLMSLEKHRYSYRFIFIPGTIGAITWLAQNQENLNIKHGLVISGVGDAGELHYKVSRRRNAGIDRSVARVLSQLNQPHTLLPWHPYGYDERQFCSPGFNLPVGNLSRSPYGSYPEYHTSGDNLDFIKAEKLSETLEVCKALVTDLESLRYYRNLAPYGEPQLGRRGLYQAMGGQQNRQDLQLALLWVLNLSDGTHALKDIAQLAKLDIDLIEHAAQLLLEHDLLESSP